MVLRTNQKLFGHRFIMDKVVPGGVTVDIDEKGKQEILAELDRLAKEFNKLVDIYYENPSAGRQGERYRHPKAQKGKGALRCRDSRKGERTQPRLPYISILFLPMTSLTVLSWMCLCLLQEMCMQGQGSGSKR